MTLDKHINQITSHSYKLLRNIGRVRHVLSNKHTDKLAHAGKMQQIDYCSNLFFNMIKANLFKLHKVQNAAARLVVRKRKRSLGWFLYVAPFLLKIVT